MFKLFQLLLLVLIPIIVVLGVFRIIAKAISQLVFSPESKQGSATLVALRSRLQGIAAGALHPWDAESLGLLSLKQNLTKKGSWLDRSREGTLMSIYQEPLFAFIVVQNGSERLILARNSEREFLLRDKGRETEIWIDEKPYATYFDGSLLESGKNSRLLARIENPSEEEHWPILIGTTEAAIMNNPAKLINPNPRAFSLLCQCSPEDEKAILAIFLARMK